MATEYTVDRNGFVVDPDGNRLVLCDWCGAVYLDSEADGDFICPCGRLGQRMEELRSTVIPEGQ